MLSPFQDSNKIFVGQTMSSDKLATERAIETVILYEVTKRFLSTIKKILVFFVIFDHVLS